MLQTVGEDKKKVEVLGLQHWVRFRNIISYGCFKAVI